MLHIVCLFLSGVNLQHFKQHITGINLTSIGKPVKTIGTTTSRPRSKKEKKHAIITVVDYILVQIIKIYKHSLTFICGGKSKIDGTAPSLRRVVCPVRSKHSSVKCTLHRYVLCSGTQILPLTWYLRAYAHSFLRFKSLGKL